MHKMAIFILILKYPYSVELVSGGRSVSSGHPATPRMWPLNTGSNAPKKT